MAHKNVIIMYKINNTNLVVAQVTKWQNVSMTTKNEHGPDNRKIIAFIASVQKSHGLH